MFIIIELSKLTEPKVAYHYLPYANGVFKFSHIFGQKN